MNQELRSLMFVVEFDDEDGRPIVGVRTPREPPSFGHKDVRPATPDEVRLLLESLAKAAA